MALDSAALTLGRLHGAALIGQPLNISVQVQLDAGADATSKCFDAEVFHADARQDTSQIRIAVEPAKQVHTYEVRILSSAPVNEPVVTLNLHYVCGEKISRLYVLLADPPDQAAASSTPPALVLSAVPAEAVKPVMTPLSAASGSLPGMASAASAKAPLSSVKKKALVRPRPPAGRQAPTRRHAHHRAPVSSKPAASTRKPKPERSAAQPRLELDKLELLPGRIENPDGPMTLAASEKALINEQKMQTLEGEVRTLRDSAARNERSLADLKVRLQQAEAERSPGAVIYILLALLICSLSALAWLWIRQRRGSLVDHGWWSDSAVKPVAVSADSAYAPVSDTSSARPDLDQAPDSNASRVAATKAGGVAGLEAHSLDLSDSTFSDFMPTDADPVVTSSPGLSRSAQPDLFGQKKELPKALDLDLSDMGIVASSVKQQPAVDIDLDLLLLGAQKAHDPTLLDMEFPETPANDGPQGRSLG